MSPNHAPIVSLRQNMAGRERLGQMFFIRLGSADQEKVCLLLSHAIDFSNGTDKCADISLGEFPMWGGLPFSRFAFYSFGFKKTPATQLLSPWLFFHLFISLGYVPTDRTERSQCLVKIMQLPHRKGQRSLARYSSSQPHHPLWT